MGQRHAWGSCDPDFVAVRYPGFLQPIPVIGCRRPGSGPQAISAEESWEGDPRGAEPGDLLRGEGWRVQIRGGERRVAGGGLQHEAELCRAGGGPDRLRALLEGPRLVALGAQVNYWLAGQ